MRALLFAIAVASSALCGCASEPVSGPDRQFAGTLGGAMTGAGAGAITGFQVSAATGPGAAVGAGFGAVAGGIQGILDDQTDENLLALAAKTEKERRVAYAQEILVDQYKRRLELHPTRDLYPADLFFYGDEATLRPGAEAIIFEIARLNKTRLSWSTLVVAAYVRSENPESTFARHLAEHRSRAIGDCLVKGGLEPRRIQARPVIVSAPVLIDPHDRPDRYNHAIELIPLDRAK